MNEINQNDIDKAHDEFNGFDKIDPIVIPTPTRTFDLEDRSFRRTQ